MKLIPDSRLTSLYKCNDKEMIQVFANDSRDSSDTVSGGRKIISPLPTFFNRKQVYRNCKGLKEEGIFYIYLFRVKKNYYALFIPTGGVSYPVVTEHDRVTMYVVYERSLYKLNAAEVATLLV